MLSLFSIFAVYENLFPGSVFTDSLFCQPIEATCCTAIAETAADLDTWRGKWLNTEGWLDWESFPAG